jgi:hypothetical protein
MTISASAWPPNKLGITNLASSHQEIPVGVKVNGMLGTVVSNAPHLLEANSQLLCLLMDLDETLVQVRCNEEQSSLCGSGAEVLLITDAKKTLRQVWRLG